MSCRGKYFGSNSLLFFGYICLFLRPPGDAIGHNIYTWCPVSKNKNYLDKKNVDDVRKLCKLRLIVLFVTEVREPHMWNLGAPKVVGFHRERVADNARHVERIPSFFEAVRVRQFYESVDV